MRVTRGQLRRIIREEARLIEGRFDAAPSFVPALDHLEKALAGLQQAVKELQQAGDRNTAHVIGAGVNAVNATLRDLRAML